MKKHRVFAYLSILTLLLIIFTACSESTPEQGAIGTAIEQTRGVEATMEEGMSRTMTAQAPTRTPTPSETPTYTPTSSPTLSSTPKPSTETPTPTVTQRVGLHEVLIDYNNLVAIDEPFNTKIATGFMRETVDIDFYCEWFGDLESVLDCSSVRILTATNELGDMDATLTRFTESAIVVVLSESMKDGHLDEGIEIDAQAVIERFRLPNDTWLVEEDDRLYLGFSHNDVFFYLTTGLWGVLTADEISTWFILVAMQQQVRLDTAGY